MVKKSRTKSPMSLGNIQFDKRTALIFAIFFAIVGTIFIFQAGAAPKSKVVNAVSLSLSPSSQRLSLNDTFTVNVLLNTNNQAVNAVQANLTYPADKLEVVGISNTGSLFEIQAENTGGSGSIRIARGTLTPVNSPDAVVGIITFKAIGTGRRLSVNFASSSAVVGSSETNILTRMVGGQYTVN